MKLVINASNLYVGGGVQVALSFINELLSLRRNDQYHIFLSGPINSEIDKRLFTSNFHFYLIRKSPASLRYRKAIVSELKELEKEINPDIVFSVFGPSYWKPKSLHLMGLANGWLYNPDSIAFRKLSLIKYLKARLSTYYSSYFIKKDAQYYVVETKDAKKKIVNHMHINETRLFVVGNTHSAVFNNPEKFSRNDVSWLDLPAKSSGLLRLVTISHNYSHKNLYIIKKVLPLLSNYNIEFVVTIDSNSFNKHFAGFNGRVINLGKVGHDQCPSIYKQCDALFFPSLLETFSASYPEAMKMGLPILTSDLTFAHDICDNAAIYFNPLDPRDIADKIKILIQDKSKYSDLVERGKTRLESFETSRSRAVKYLTCCQNIISEIN